MCVCGFGVDGGNGMRGELTQVVCLRGYLPDFGEINFNETSIFVSHYSVPPDSLHSETVI